MDIGGVPLSELTPPALLGFGILSIIVGWLVPRRIYLDMVRDRDAEKLARQKSEEQNQALILASSKIAAAVLEALPRPQEDQ